MKSPPEIIYTGMKRNIGSPVDISINEKNGNFNLHGTDLKIPIQETDQKKVFTIGNGSQDEDDNYTFNQ